MARSKSRAPTLERMVPNAVGLEITLTPTDRAAAAIIAPEEASAGL